MATDGYIGPYEPITEQENKCSNPACLCENCDCIPCYCTALNPCKCAKQ